MPDYIVTIKWPPRSLLDSGKEKYRLYASNEEMAAAIMKKSPSSPINGQIVKIRAATYKKK